LVPDKIKVIFIAGWSRSGSTLLASLLGQYSGNFNAGEFGFFWERGLLKDLNCSCGVSFSDCPTWKNVVETGSFDKAKIDLVNLTHKEFFRNANILRFRDLTNPSPGLAEKIDLTQRLFQATRKATGCDVIIDATKIPAYGVLLRQIPQLDVYCIHLVRDPRAVAYSFSRTKMEQKTTVESAVRWIYFNSLIEAFLKKPLKKYMFLRYEDFVISPQYYIDQILTFAGIAPGECISVQEHTFSGNPGRLEKNALIIKPDNDWQEKPRRMENAQVSLIDFFLMKKYQYL
jgi:hypothetical protein